MYGCGKYYLLLIPFRLPQISCFNLSLKCFSSDSDHCPDVEAGHMLQLPHPPRAGPVLLTLLFHPSSFVLPSSEWFYIFFSSGQVLLSALSWCSECTSVSECVFLMYPWREMYSMSTYSSPILFSLLFQLLISKFLSILSLRFLIFLQDLHPALKGISNHLEWSTHTQPYSDIVVCAQTGGWNLKKIFFNIYLFICLCWVVAHGLWSTWAQ